MKKRKRNRKIIIVVLASFLLLFSTKFMSSVFMSAHAALPVTWLGYTTYGYVYDVNQESFLYIRPEPGNLSDSSGGLGVNTRVAIIGYTSYDPSDPWSPWYAIDVPNTPQKYASEYTVGYVSGQYVNVPVTGIGITQPTADIKVGTSVSAGYNLYPPCASNQNVSWSSDNSDIASVDGNGVVYGKTAGVVSITVTSEDGNFSSSCYFNVKPLVSNITLSKTNIVTGIGVTENITATVSPDDSYDKSVSWESDNTAVASIDQSGNITGKSVGTATVIARANDGSNVTATCSVTVKPLVYSVALDEDSVTIPVGREIHLTATVAPDDAFNKNLSWESSDSSVVTVDSNGNVKAVSSGTAVVTAKTTDGSNVFDTCAFNVKPLVSSIKIQPSESNLYVGQEEALVAVVSPENAYDRSVTWTSSDESIAKVDQNGVVTALDDGTVSITAKANDGSGVAGVCNYTIEWIPSGIALSKKNSVLKEGTGETLTALFDPIAVDRDVVWNSSNESVVTVDQNGHVTAVAAGNAVVTAMLTNGSEQSASCNYTVKALVKSISVNPKSIVTVLGKTVHVNATLSPNDLYDSSISWSSSDKSVATVDQNGNVKAKGAGVAKITVKANDGSGITCTFTVTINAPISWISLDKNSIELKKGTTFALTATVYPSTATNKTIKWTSSNTKVATVDAKGVVTAVDGGKATITASSVDGSGKNDVCHVTVIVLVTKIELNKYELSMSAGNTAKLTAKVLPANATNKKIKWSTSDSSMAMVDNNGSVWSRAGGVAKIRATAEDGSGVFAECTVLTNYPRTGWVANISYTSYLNIRKDHKLNSMFITKIPYAEKLTVTAPAVDGWYPVVLSDGNRGYACADYIVFTEPAKYVPTAKGSFTESTVYPRKGWAGNMSQDSKLNIRSTPGGKILTQIAYATEFTVTGQAENGWYPVKLSNGRVGFASATYTVFTKPSMVKSTKTQTDSKSSTPSKTTVQGYPKTAWVCNVSSYLIIRSGKGTNYKSIANVKNATQLTVTGPAENGWYPVKLQNGVRGYASSRYISFSKPNQSRIILSGDADYAINSFSNERFTISLRSNIGNYRVMNHTCKNKGSFTLPSLPDSDGYTFVGWYKNNDFVEKKFQEMAGLNSYSKEILPRGRIIYVSSNCTYYAVWARKKGVINDLNQMFANNAKYIISKKAKDSTKDKILVKAVWIDFVREGGKWDFKNIDNIALKRYPDLKFYCDWEGEFRWCKLNKKYILLSDADIGNINYAYTGRQLFSLRDLLRGGDYVALGESAMKKLFDPRKEIKLDPPEDKYAINFGYNLAKNAGY